MHFKQGIFNRDVIGHISRKSAYMYVIETMTAAEVEYRKRTSVLPQFKRLYPRHTGGAAPLRCLYGINRSGTAMIAVVPQWFRH